MPTRIQRKRSKGWRMPENAVYVGRPTKWGNPFKVDDTTTPADAVSAYRQWIGRQHKLLQALPELRGKDLVCWCRPGAPCHADVLIELANAPEQGGEMHIYLIDDGETWWIVAESAEQALELARRDDIDYWRELSASDVVQLPDDSTVKVQLMDGLHRSDAGLYPIKRYCRYYNGGGWVCEATAAEWAGMRQAGDIIASTVY